MLFKKDCSEEHGAIITFCMMILIGIAITLVAIFWERRICEQYGDETVMLMPVFDASGNFTRMIPTYAKECVTYKAKK